MKRFILTFLFILVSINPVMAENILFNNEVYDLQFATKTPTGYINEYIRNFQHQDDWTKKVTVHHFVDGNTVETYLAGFNQRIKYLPSYIKITYDNQKNILSYDTIYVGENFIEYNIFKVKKHPIKGLLALQYSQRYYYETETAMNGLIALSQKEDIKFFNLMQKTEIPAIVEKEIDKF